MNLTVVIPAYNEEAVIEDTLRDLQWKFTIPHQAVVVNKRTKGNSSLNVFKVARNYARWYVWALLFRKHRF
jgi:cellulose synthase/poly-beta-1,6-N-acetylglucosamine synthase-like glycosyltransferase